MMGSESELAGQTLADRYDLLELIGSGGMGTVYRAHDRELDELVALKVIHADLATSAHAVERFRREVKLARRVTHTNVARTFELVHAGGLMFYTMELVEGESLRDRLRRTGTCPLGEAIAIVTDVCAGLAAAHLVGVIHRDIKPDNILIAAGGRVVVADFGIATVAVGPVGETSGTPAYMAPEQARGEPATPATDVYALGHVLYEMLAGSRAFHGSSDQVLAAKRHGERGELHLDALPPELAAVIARAVAPEPEGRLARIEDLARLLAPWAKGAVPGTAVPAARTAARGLRDVVVVAPRALTDGARVHLAGGVQDLLLERLSALPGVRVLPRDRAPDRDALSIELAVADELSAVTRSPGATRLLALPLDVAELELAAGAIAAATAEVLDRAAPDANALAARELLLEAQQTSRYGINTVEDAAELVARARALAPDDPRIAAVHAMLVTRDAMTRTTPAVEAAERLVEHALRVAPEQAEAHVAAGHLELHTGEAPRAAVHYRRAIACSRYCADAHDGLGRLLLEAGFVEHGLARLDDALAIAPNLAMVRWEIARAHALEGQWDACDAVMRELVGRSDRFITRLRCTWWRGDRAAVVLLRDHARAMGGFDSRMLDILFGSMLDGAWLARRADMLDVVYRNPERVRRRRAFSAQLGAELASGAGDIDTAVQLIDYATDEGLFDRHWIERCPVLEAARQSGRLARAHARIKHRAEAILDALYGEAAPENLADTVAG